MLSSAHKVGTSEDAEGGGLGCTLGGLVTTAATGGGSGVPKAGMAGATWVRTRAACLVKTPSSRKAKTAARAAAVFAIFLLEKAAFWSWYVWLRMVHVAPKRWRPSS